MYAIAALSLLSLAAAVPPNWYNGACGESKYADAGDMALPAGQRMIVGGIAAREHEFPWMASMRTPTGSHFCGGSIINENWILTAAHCMRGETPSSVRVVVGDHIRNQNNAVRMTLTVAQIEVHPNYGPLRLVNDVALVRVSTPIPFSADIQPVCGPEPTDDFAYRKSSCSGWGTIASGGVCCPQELRYVSLNVTTNAFCDAAYASDDISDDMICASDNIGGTERDSCQGDSGGPLVVKDPGTGAFTLVGVVSWGIGCASGYPGVYSRVSYQNDWILSIINAV
jgi:secreted trypsin-like serine protease